MRKLYILIVLGLLANQNLRAQRIGEGVEVNIANGDDFSGFEVLDSAIQNARVVMTGENHTYVKFNSKMELKMLRYLNKNVGTRNFVIELGPARAHYLNRYINEKDTTADRYLRATTSPRYMDLFKRMRKFNKTLPDSLKITVYGIDVERFNDLPLMRLSELLPRENLPQSIRVGVEAVHGAVDYLEESGLQDYEIARDETQSDYNYNYRSQPFYISSTIFEFLRYYDSLKTDFDKLVGDKKGEIDEVIGWLREYQQWLDYENTTYQYIWREENIYKNLSKLVRLHPAERFYGQFGRCHVAYEEQNGDCGWYGYHSVINKMRTRYFHSMDSLLTIGLFYSGSGDNNYYSDREDDESLQKEIDFLLENSHNKKVTLFGLKDSAADLPRLSNKFSYAFVNDNVDEDEMEDSTDTDIITDIEEIGSDGLGFTFYAVGLTLSNRATSKLQNHLENNGYTASLPRYNMYNIAVGTYIKNFSQQMQVSFIPLKKLGSNDSGDLSYGTTQFSYELAYPIVKKGQFPHHWSLSAGATSSYASEKISWQKKDTGFFQPLQNLNFVHRAFLIGPSVNLDWTLGEIFYFGLKASQLFDLTQSKWKHKGSSGSYGEKGTVSNNFTGTYISLNFGFCIPIKNTYNEYDY